MLNEKIKQESAFIDILLNEIGKVIVGQHIIIEKMVVGLISNGHILLEGVPGLAKTLAIKTLAASMKAKFQRIQFTPDLLPADLVGTMIYNQKDGNFFIRKGPIFANFILADEINRAPAKVQSALLEAMQERQVTIGETTYKLQEPFLVLATQNPIEQEGTYPLPEAQVDRFMLKLKITYPSREEELKIMRQNINFSDITVNQVISPEDILRARGIVNEVYIDEKIEKYILDIVFATRSPQQFDLGKLTDLISYGASPRASIYLALGAKAMAFIKRRGYVIPEDVRAICSDVLRHRIAVTYEAEAEDISQDHIISEIAAKECERICSLTIRELQGRTEGLNSGDDSGLKNIWDEVCVQVQHDQSLLWDYYVEDISIIITELLKETPEFLLEAMWLQTEAGWDWAWDNDDSDEPEDLSICEDDIVDFILNKYVLTKAGGWENKAIRNYLNRC